jgi:hypothetical protein
LDTAKARKQQHTVSATSGRDSPRPFCINATENICNHKDELAVMKAELAAMDKHNADSVSATALVQDEWVRLVCNAVWWKMNVPGVSKLKTSCLFWSRMWYFNPQGVFKC